MPTQTMVSEPTVRVEVDGREIALEGRAAAMVAYLARNAERVNVAQKGHVAFDFAFNDITPRIHGIDAAISVPKT